MLVYIILLLLVILKSDAAYFPEDTGLQFWVTVIDLLIPWHLKHKRTCRKVLRFRNVMFEMTIDIGYQK